MTEQPVSGFKSVDSLSAHEFEIELNGQPVGGIFSVEGLASYMLIGDIPPLVISKMVQQDPNTPFNAWVKVAQQGGQPTRDVAIVATDEGTETRRWVYRDAIITAVQFSNFDTSSSELVEEKITIKAATVEEVWE